MQHTVGRVCCILHSVPKYRVGSVFETVLFIVESAPLTTAFSAKLRGIPFQRLASTAKAHKSAKDQLAPISAAFPLNKMYYTSHVYEYYQRSLYFHISELIFRR